jgi:hypothetical protein
VTPRASIMHSLNIQKQCDLTNDERPWSTANTNT